MFKNRKKELRLARKSRIRRKVKGTQARPRLTIFRSLHHIYAQVINDEEGRTLASASTLDKELRDAVKDLSPMEKAEKVGELVARRCLEKGIEAVVFDRNGYKYHGKVKKLADSARKAGLKL